MTTKRVAIQQYQSVVDRTAARFGDERIPREGWIATVRKALGMSGPQLGKRLGVGRARISQAEQAELTGGISLKAMQAAAEAMGCRFVYAIVPDGRIEDVVAAQARKKARSIVARASLHMALESQVLPEAQNADDIERISRDLIRTMPANLWADS
jgi:predicted DNA-binding mobile mystery protein A